MYIIGNSWSTQMFGAMCHALKFDLWNKPTPRPLRWSLLLLTRSITLLIANVFVVLLYDLVCVPLCVFFLVLFVLEIACKMLLTSLLRQMPHSKHYSYMYMWDKILSCSFCELCDVAACDCCCCWLFASYFTRFLHIMLFGFGQNFGQFSHMQVKYYPNATGKRSSHRYDCHKYMRLILIYMHIFTHKLRMWAAHWRAACAISQRNAEF